MKTTFDIQLSKNFKLSEFVQTNYADFQLLDCLQFTYIRLLVIDFLEPLRQTLKCPIIINSGFRGQTVNEKVGGVKNSLHKLGCAADICSKVATPQQIYDTLNTLIKKSVYPSDSFELIKYPTFVHIGFNPDKIFQNYENKDY